MKPLWMILEERVIIYTPEGIAIEYARKYEGDDSAEALREKFDKEMKEESARKVGAFVVIAVLCLMGWLAAVFVG